MSTTSANFKKKGDSPPTGSCGCSLRQQEFQFYCCIKSSKGPHFSSLDMPHSVLGLSREVLIFRSFHNNHTYYGKKKKKNTPKQLLSIYYVLDPLPGKEEDMTSFLRFYNLIGGNRTFAMETIHNEKDVCQYNTTILICVLQKLRASYVI